MQNFPNGTETGLKSSCGLQRGPRAKDPQFARCNCDLQGNWAIGILTEEHFTGETFDTWKDFTDFLKTRLLPTDLDRKLMSQLHNLCIVWNDFNIIHQISGTCRQLTMPHFCARSMNDLNPACSKRSRQKSSQLWIRQLSTYGKCTWDHNQRGCRTFSNCTSKSKTRLTGN